jgi:hypothetical protein
LLRRVKLTCLEPEHATLTSFDQGLNHNEILKRSLNDEITQYLDSTRIAGTSRSSVDVPGTRIVSPMALTPRDCGLVHFDSALSTFRSICFALSA